MYNNNYVRENIKIMPDIKSRIEYFKYTNFEFDVHWHPYVEIGIVIKGSLQISLDDTVLDVPEEDIYVINSSQLHAIRYVGTCEVLTLHIPVESFKLFIPDFDFVYLDNSIKEDYFIETSELIRSLYNIYKTACDGWQLLYQSKLYNLMYLLYCNGYKSHSTVNSKKSQQIIERLEVIISYTEAYYKDPILLSSVAGIVGLNPEYFCRFFKKHMGTSYQNYLSTVRITHIYDEIVATDDKIADILRRNGFNNYHLFLKMFKEMYGTSPNQLRKNK
ncbi:MAG: helix-turn-helix transcriptional regulator [Lachnospiraceae bacterium]|nr:helix-turn-helix transcriptional regulator [Lachnospiraceae bacterium]